MFISRYRDGIIKTHPHQLGYPGDFGRYFYKNLHTRLTLIYLISKCYVIQSTWCYCNNTHAPNIQHAQGSTMLCLVRRGTFPFYWYSSRSLSWHWGNLQSFVFPKVIKATLKACRWIYHMLPLATTNTAVWKNTTTFMHTVWDTLPW